MIRRISSFVLLWLLVLPGAAGPATAGVESDRPVPARVVTLAPHLAELVHAAGAIDRLAGVSAWTDYPPAASELPRVGDAFGVDIERIAAIDPELILAWEGGTPPELIRRLDELGFPVMTVRTGSLEDVAVAIERIGVRLGSPAIARAAAAEFRAALDDVASAHGEGSRLRVFYQVAARPLYTVSGRHYISELIRRCGGRNVFADLDDLAPVVGVESVLARDPEVILAAGSDPELLAGWRRWESLTAVQAGNLHVLPPDTLARPAPRLVKGAADICAAIEASRQRLTR